MKADNNHGVWYDFQCLGIALYLDSNDLAKKLLIEAYNVWMSSPIVNIFSIRISANEFLTLFCF